MEADLREAGGKGVGSAWGGGEGETKGFGSKSGSITLLSLKSKPFMGYEA